MTRFDIKITSDTVCPWCYIGLRRLQRAIVLFQKSHPTLAGHTFNITWHPFYLDPDAPLPSIPKAQAYIAKFGPERAKQIVATLTAVGEQEGINFSFLGNTGRTRDSHRLISWAGTPQAATLADADAVAAQDTGDTLQTQVAIELFKSYFEREEDITSRATLAAAAERAGLPPSGIAEFLESENLGGEVDAEVKWARNDGAVTGVPHFVINNRFEVSGAQEPAAFAQLFERVMALEQKAS